jgi:hypothetical protein
MDEDRKLRIFYKTYKKGNNRIIGMIIISYGPTTYSEDLTFKLLYEQYLLEEIPPNNVFEYIIDLLRTYLPYCNIGNIDNDNEDGIQIIFNKFDESTAPYKLVNVEPNYHHIETWYRNNICVYLEYAISSGFCSS